MKKIAREIVKNDRTTAEFKIEEVKYPIRIRK